MRKRGVKVGGYCGPLVAVLALSISSAKSGLAEPLSEVTVRWEAPPDCPDRVALDQELRRDLEGSQAPSIRVHVDASVVQLNPETWRVSIRTESGAGQSERAITAHSCSALVDATSLIIAMLIDPETAATHARPIEGTREAAGPAPATVVNSTNPAPASSSAAPAAVPMAPIAPIGPNFQRNPITREAKNKNTVHLGPAIQSPAGSHWPIAGLAAAWVAGDTGSLPRLTEALGGSLGLLYGPLRVQTSFGYFSPRSNVLTGPPKPGAAGEFGKIAGSAELCLRAFARSRFDLSPCAGLEVARLSGTGSGELTNQHTEHRPVASAEVGVLGILNLTNALALRFDLDVLLPLNRPKFGYYDQNNNPIQVFQPALLAARAGLGVELHFP
jgi:hypothetical protein